MCLRILHVVGIMNRGGTETLIMSLFRQMNRKKIQFDFVVHGTDRGEYEEEIVSMGGRIFRAPCYKGINHLAYVKWWKNFFQEHTEYSIIHGHMRSTAAIYLKIAGKYQRVSIAHSHNTGSRGNCVVRAIKNIYQYPIRFVADYYLACSMDAGIWLFGKQICESERYCVLNNAIDTRKFVFCEDMRKQKRSELGITDEFVIGHVGNFAYQKNHSFLVDVFEEISKREQDCVLLLIGGGEPAVRKQIEDKLKEKNLTDKVRILGSRSDVAELLNAFDMFVFPSRHEGLGIVAVEAQANGLPCVLSDVIPQEVKVTDNVEYISLKEDKTVWAEHILRYRGMVQRENMQEQIIAAGYDIEKVVQWLTDFYLKIADRGYI